MLIRLSARSSGDTGEPLVGNVGEFLLLLVASALFVTGTLQAERRQDQRTTNKK